MVVKSLSGLLNVALLTATAWFGWEFQPRMQRGEPCP